LKFGLEDLDIQKIQSVFTQFPEIQKVIIYGSRAKGNFKMGSDIDLTIVGENLSFSLLLSIRGVLDDLNLPYLFDVSIFTSLENLSLIEHINRVGQEFYALDNK
jgi:uncharacterized protein